MHVLICFFCCLPYMLFKHFLQTGCSNILLRCKPVPASNPSLATIRPVPYTTKLAETRSSTTVYYKACTKRFQYYPILQSLQKHVPALPYTTRCNEYPSPPSSSGTKQTLPWIRCTYLPGTTHLVKSLPSSSGTKQTRCLEVAWWHLHAFTGFKIFQYLATREVISWTISKYMNKVLERVSGAVSSHVLLTLAHQRVSGKHSKQWNAESTKWVILHFLRLSARRRYTEQGSRESQQMPMSVWIEEMHLVGIFWHATSSTDGYNTVQWIPESA